jgi:hypothetical protein
MSTPMRRLRAARAASWPDPEASIRDAHEFMLGADDGSPFHQQAQNLIASIDVCLWMASRGCYSGKLGQVDDLRWLRRSLSELLGRLNP